jgi:hypothetical protein
VRANNSCTDALIKQELNKLCQSICTVRPNWNTKYVPLLQDNARPHTNLRTRETVTKTGWTILPHRTHSPELALSDYDLFGPVKNARRGRHFADDNELKVFVTCSEDEAGNFTTLIYSVLLNVGKSWLVVKTTLWKNSPIIAKDVRIVHVNLLLLQFDFLMEKMGTFLSYRPSYLRNLLSPLYDILFAEF